MTSGCRRLASLGLECEERELDGNDGLVGRPRGTHLRVWFGEKDLLSGVWLAKMDRLVILFDAGVPLGGFRGLEVEAALSIE